MKIISIFGKLFMFCLICAWTLMASGTPALAGKTNLPINPADEKAIDQHYEACITNCKDKACYDKCGVEAIEKFKQMVEEKLAAKAAGDDKKMQEFLKSSSQTYYSDNCHCAEKCAQFHGKAQIECLKTCMQHCKGSALK